MLCLVPGLSHATSYREQEALDKSGGVRVRRSLHLRRRHSDFPFPPANHRSCSKIGVAFELLVSNALPCSYNHVFTEYFEGKKNIVSDRRH